MGDPSTARAPISRGVRARERVLRAALDVLVDQGMPGFTMEAVAQRAGASKATVYRHWSARSALLADAMDLAFQPFPVPPGDVRSSLVGLLSTLQEALAEQPFPRLMAAFIDAAERDPALGRLHARLSEARREPVRQVLVRAVGRGEIPAGTDVDLAVDLLVGPAFYRRLIVHRPFPEGRAAALVDRVLRALAAT